MAVALARNEPQASLKIRNAHAEAGGSSRFADEGWSLIPARALRESAARRHPLLGFQDPLTGLANRLALTHILDGLIDDGCEFGLILLDLDGFKDVNDTLGHDAGDEVLRSVAATLDGAKGSNGAVARLGGDEFAVVADTACRRSLLQLASRLCEKIGTELKSENFAFIHASAGAALYPSHARSRSELLKCADIALYDAKNKGRNRAVGFQKTMQERVQRRALMLQRAAACLGAPDKLVVTFQPKVDLLAGEVTGYEALLRCRGHHGRLRSPGWIEAAFADDFLSRGIGEVVVDQALDFVQSLLREGRHDAKVAINVTRVELFRRGWANSLLKRIEKEYIPAACVELEVNESVLLGPSSGLVMRNLRELHDAGIRISLDDFGTGYASLQHLRACPVDVLKIDRSFIKSLNDVEVQAIVRAIIDLGRALHMVVIAEGVENERQHRLLKEWGCTEGQGYLYGRPSPQQRWLNKQSQLRESDAEISPVRKRIAT